MAQKNTSCTKQHTSNFWALVPWVPQNGGQNFSIKIGQRWC